MNKQVLFTKEQELSNAKNLAKETVKKLNLLISNSEDQFKIKFSDNEKLEILNNGSKFLNDLLESRFMFPKATKEFNKNALGIDIDHIISEFNTFGQRFKSYNFSMNKSGQFELEAEQKQYDACIKFLENDNQKSALDLSEKICALMNEAVTLGHIDSNKLYAMKDFGKLFDVKSSSMQRSTDLVPNLYRISYIK